MSRGEAGPELPEAPGVRGELALQLAWLPAAAAVPAELNATDPPVAGEGDTGELDRPRRQRRSVRGPIDARHRLDDGSLVPAVVFPLTGLIARRETDARDPLGLLHPVTAGIDEARGEAVHRGQGRAVEMGGEQMVCCQAPQVKALRIAIRAFRQHPGRVPRRRGTRHNV